MNPYNSPYHFPQHTPGPPQPPWQAPPRRPGWQDPGRQQPPPPPPPPPPPAQPSPVSLYNPNAFGPMPSAPSGPFAPSPAQGAQHDTSLWAERYNQSMQNQGVGQRPPLPPRQTSAVSQPNPKPEQGNVAHYPRYGHGTSNEGISQAPSQQYTTGLWSHPHHVQPQQPSSGLPPPPPPRPPEYQTQVQSPSNWFNAPHEYYSHGLPSHHYDPQPQHLWNAPAAESAGGHSGPMYHLTGVHQQPVAPSSEPAPLVSPIESGSDHWGARQGTVSPPNPSKNLTQATVLGSGLPFDWEHFETQASHGSGSGGGNQIQTPTESQQVNPIFVSPPQVNAEATTSSAASGKPGPSSSPGAGQRKDKPAASIKESPDQVPANVTTSGASDSTPSAPGQQDHLPSVTISEGDNHGPGHIDSVIHAWSSPLQPSARQDHTVRPDSRSSNATAPPEVPAIVKVVDPYSDLEPEFRASLNRFAAMLGKESAADTDEEKFEIFQAFVSKELRLRSLLYGVELPNGIAQANGGPRNGPKGQGENSTTLSSFKEPRPDDVKGRPDEIETHDRQSGRLSSAPQEKDQKHGLGEMTPRGHEQVDRDRVDHAPSSESPAPPSSKTASLNESSILNDQSHMSVPAPMSVVQEEKASEPKRACTSNAEKALELQASWKQNNLSAEKTTSDGERKSAETSPSRPSSRTKESLPFEEFPRPKVAVKPRDDLIDGDVEPEYSPGGRPRIRGASPKAPPVVKLDPSAAAVMVETPRPPSGDEDQSASNDAPVVIEDYVMPEAASSGGNAPILLQAEQDASVASSGHDKGGPLINFQPPRPVYTPFRYNEAAQSQQRLSLERPADQSYSSLRNQVVSSGRLMAPEPIPTPTPVSPTSGRKEHEEAFVGLIRQHSKAVRKKTSDRPSLVRAGDIGPRSLPVSMRAGTPAANTKAVDRLKSAVTAVRTTLPRSVSGDVSQHAKLAATQETLEAMPDQFGFIHETVLAWDRASREVRKTQDAERHARQAESEAHIDDLFNDNEIGYADIGVMEAEFKLAEAERKYQEDQQELESFIAQVFTPVTARIQKEIAELDKAYTTTVDLLDSDSEPASRYLRADGNPAPMFEVLNCLLTIFNKREIRHQKVAEAQVERERRRKRLELTVLYTNGDTTGVKSLEQEFAVAENLQVLEEARHKDARANKLVDAFDRATVRGLGDNQTFVDDLLPRLRDLRSVILADKHELPPTDLYEADGPRDTLSFAQDAVHLVLADSRKLLSLAREADSLLNNADYAVSVAAARVAHADKATYTKLEQEKAKEDAKIVDETNSRISGVQKAPEEALALIREVVDRIGDDPEHQLRIKKALEAAKQRNAATDTQPPPD